MRDSVSQGNHFAARRPKPPAPQPQPGYTIRKKDRNWAVIDPQGQLVCLTAYKRGAVEVVRRLAA